MNNANEIAKNITPNMNKSNRTNIKLSGIVIIEAQTISNNIIPLNRICLSSSIYSLFTMRSLFNAYGGRERIFNFHNVQRTSEPELLRGLTTLFADINPANQADVRVLGNPEGRRPVGRGGPKGRRRMDNIP